MTLWVELVKKKKRKENGSERRGKSPQLKLVLIISYSNTFKAF